MTSERYGLVLREVGRIFGGKSAASAGAGQLLERFASDRDPAAFEALVGRHGPMVLGTCRRMLSDPLDVEDAFQATFLVLARKAGSIQDADRLGPWLHGVARRISARSRALSGRRKAFERPGSEEPAADSHSPDALEGAELRQALDEELSRLPEKYRAPLVLCYLEGLTHDEAAETLRWPVGTVRSRLAGGRDRLRDRLTRRGLAPSAAVPAILSRAPIPQALLTATIRVATSPGSPSSHVAALAKGVLIAMTWNKLKMIAVVGLMAGFTVGGAGAVAKYGGSGQDEAKARVEPKIEAKVEPKIEQKIEQKVEATPKPPLEVVESELAAVRGVVASTAKRLEQLRFEYNSLIVPLEKHLADLHAQEAALTEKWRKLAADTTADQDRIRQLEKQVADQAAVIRSLKTQGAKLGESAPPADELKKAASPRPRPVAPVVMALGEDHVLLIPSEQDRVTVLDTRTNKRATQRFPGEMTEFTPIVGPSGLVALHLKGPELRLVSAFDMDSGQWYPQDLKEPAKVASPVVGNLTLNYHVGRFLYVFSYQAKKWGILELKRDPGHNSNIFAGLNGNQDGKMMIPEGDLIHVYDPDTGEWTHIDTKDDK